MSHLTGTARISVIAAALALITGTAVTGPAWARDGADDDPAAVATDDSTPGVPDDSPDDSPDGPDDSDGRDDSDDSRDDAPDDSPDAPDDSDGRDDSRDDSSDDDGRDDSSDDDSSDDDGRDDSSDDDSRDDSSDDDSRGDSRADDDSDDSRDDASNSTGGDDRVRKIREGICEDGSDWKLKAKTRDGRIEVELEIDSDDRGERWKYVIKHNGDKAAAGTRKTRGLSGSFTVKQRLDDTQGTDVIRSRAKSAVSGEICSARVKI